ncbi:MAG: flavodoxin-dependent (E)-4-hydroxy-3-methylbut-2-enyl-diphosphate synthase [Caldiserica bacterium]|nr:flavodoxin-dependent (E)-4-hydroxy-3-methylbut-2-enyl-diphosphate synthase [Caldisericota bacterium]
MTKPVRIGKNLVIGGGAPVVVQSMTKTDTRDTKATIDQIKRLANAGCELIRCAVPDMEAAHSLKEIVKYSPIPVCADIHFDGRLALASLDSGVNKLRLNPGNIRDKDMVKVIARECLQKGVPIRIGVNAGSLPHGQDDIAKAMVDAAIKEAGILEDAGCSLLILSVKTSDIEATIRANRLLAQSCDYPLHIGLTEAGTLISGLIRSTKALMPLLEVGLGDTIRVSLTEEPELEVHAAWELLEVTHRRHVNPIVISCPTCGRTHGKLRENVLKVQQSLRGLTGVTVAVMGCEVNGPGEAKDADCGIAFGESKAMVVEAGKIVGTLPHDIAIKMLTEIARRIYDTKNLLCGTENERGRPGGSH